MAIVAGLFAGLFGHLLGPRKGALAAVPGISLYTILVAAIMGGLSIFVRQVGRRQHGLNTLANAVGALRANVLYPNTRWPRLW